MVNTALSASPSEKRQGRLRSCLAIHFSQEEDFLKALESGASAIFLSLGACRDASARRSARAVVKSFLKEAHRRVVERPLLYVRIAPVESEAAHDDLAALIDAAPEGFLLEETCGAESVQHLSAKMAVHEAETGLPDGGLKIIALAAQTPASVFRLGAFAGASRRLQGLVFDGEALQTALTEAPQPLPLEDENSPPIALARSLLALGASAAELAAIDGPFRDLADEAGLRVRCLAARREGFTAKVALSPSQADIINEAFA